MNTTAAVAFYSAAIAINAAASGPPVTDPVVALVLLGLAAVAVVGMIAFIVWDLLR